MRFQSQKDLLKLAHYWEKNAPSQQQASNICQLNQLSERGKCILEASVRKSSRNKYKVYWKKWDRFCSENKVKEVNVSITSVINLLSKFFYEKASYSVIKAAKSDLTHKLSLSTFNSTGCLQKDNRVTATIKLGQLT